MHIFNWNRMKITIKLILSNCWIVKTSEYQVVVTEKIRSSIMKVLLLFLFLFIAVVQSNVHKCVHCKLLFYVPFCELLSNPDIIIQLLESCQS